MLVRQLIVIGTVLLAACGGPPAPADPAAADASEAVRLGGPASGTGTVTADSGEPRPVDPATFNKVPGYSPYAGRNYPERPYFGDEHVHGAAFDVGFALDFAFDGDALPVQGAGLVEDSGDVHFEVAFRALEDPSGVFAADGHHAATELA